MDRSPINTFFSRVKEHDFHNSANFVFILPKYPHSRQIPIHENLEPMHKGNFLKVLLGGGGHVFQMTKHPTSSNTHLRDIYKNKCRICRELAQGCHLVLQPFSVRSPQLNHRPQKMTGVSVLSSLIHGAWLLPF